MKLKNLFFASVAVAGLFSACSNGMDEIVDNNGNNETNGETAYMQVGFGYPATSSSTRATDAGDVSEQNFTNVRLIICNSAGLITDAVLLTADQFAPEGSTGGAAGSNDTKYYISKAAIPVTKYDATNAKVYAFVNPKGAVLSVAVGATLATDAQYAITTADGITEYAKDKNFYMSNEGGKAVETKIEGTKAAPTPIKVRVERITAKLQETTANRTFTAKNANLDKPNDDLSIALEQYAYTNLNKKSYILRKDDATYQGIDHNFDTSYTPDAEFFYPNVASNNTEAGYGFKAWAATNITYCFENTVTADDQYTDKTVGILYKATASFKGQTPGTTFYTYLNTVYFNYADLKTAYDKTHTSATLTATDEYTVVDLNTKGINKYVNGVCYYRVMIKHEPNEANMAPMEFAIVRNNLYKMAVTSINGLGDPFIPTTPDPDETDKAQIELTIDVAPWTVRSNENIEL